MAGEHGKMPVWPDMKLQVAAQPGVADQVYFQAPGAYIVGKAGQEILVAVIDLHRQSRDDPYLFPLLRCHVARNAVMLKYGSDK